MAELGASKVIIRETDPPVRLIQSAATSVAGMVGIAERGPIGTAVRVGSWEDYVRVFGGFVPGADLPHAVLGFFQNGGRVLYVVRTAHYQDADDIASVTAAAATGALLGAAVPTPATVVGATAGPFALVNGDALSLAVDGGAPISIRFDGTPARLATAAPGPFLLADGMTLEVQTDGAATQTVTFRAADFAVINQATAVDVAQVLGRDLTGVVATATPAGIVELATASAGRASSIRILGGTGVAAVGFAADAAQGTGTVDRLGAVTIGQIDQLLAAANVDARASAGPAGELVLRTVSVGPQASLEVQAPTAIALGLDTIVHTGAAGVGDVVLRVRGRDPGSYANRLTVTVRPATNGTFDVLVAEGARVRESFVGLSMDRAHARYAPTIINHPRGGSTLIAVTDTALAGHPAPVEQTLALAHGDDGLGALADADFLGSPVARSGLRALDAVADLSIAMLPGRSSAIAHGGLLAYAEQVRRGLVFAILDPASGMSADEIASYATATLEGRSERGALYWPRIVVPNPSPRTLGPAETIVVPPSGHIAGVYARTDASSAGGVYTAPAGVDVGRLIGVLGEETGEVSDENARDLVFPRRVNPIRQRYVDGARTLKADGNFPSVPERRGASFIERSLSLGLDRVRHRSNTPELRAEVYRTVFQFLLAQMNLGAFASRDPRTAFFVDVSDAVNPPSSVMAGVLRLRVGIATAKPAEFIVIELSSDTRALEDELANAEA